MKILAVGDVVGRIGVEFLQNNLHKIKKDNKIDICITNGENSENGNGISKSSAEALLNSGVDLITTGNHVYRRKEVYDYLDESEFVIRPLNFKISNPGKGVAIIDKGYYKVAVINAIGRVYMEQQDDPFECVEKVIKDLDTCKVKIIDFHAEATSEKRAMGYFLDGRVSVVFGTHTHVQTSDNQILPNGTGYITDLGMTGIYNSVLGINKDIILRKFMTGMPVKFDYVNNDKQNEACTLQGCIFEVDEVTGATISTERIFIT